MHYHCIVEYLIDFIKGRKRITQQTITLATVCFFLSVGYWHQLLENKYGNPTSLRSRNLSHDDNRSFTSNESDSFKQIKICHVVVIRQGAMVQ